MNILPGEAAIVRHLLTGQGEPPSLAELAEFEERLDEEAPQLGQHVFRLVCMLGTEARALQAQNQKERKAMREQLGKKALPKGVGPAKVNPVFAPSLNEWNSLNPWQKTALRDATDKAIADAKDGWPHWPCGSVFRTVMEKKEARVVQEGGRKRAVVITRESSVRPDELSVDVLGGKCPVDRLVHAGVLRGDTARWLVRYCNWRPAARGDGRVIVDVYEVGG